MYGYWSYVLTGIFFIVTNFLLHQLLKERVEGLAKPRRIIFVFGLASLVTYTTWAAITWTSPYHIYFTFSLLAVSVIYALRKDYLTFSDDRSYKNLLKGKVAILSFLIVANFLTSFVGATSAYTLGLSLRLPVAQRQETQFQFTIGYNSKDYPAALVTLTEQNYIIQKDKKSFIPILTLSHNNWSYPRVIADLPFELYIHFSPFPVKTHVKIGKGTSFSNIFRNISILECSQDKQLCGYNGLKEIERAGFKLLKHTDFLGIQSIGFRDIIVFRLPNKKLIMLKDLKPPMLQKGPTFQSRAINNYWPIYTDKRFKFPAWYKTKCNRAGYMAYWLTCGSAKNNAQLR